MHLLFLIPLLLGLARPKLHKHFLRTENAKSAYSSFLKGAFDIYGAHSVYPSFYLPVGLLLLLVALGFEIYHKRQLEIKTESNYLVALSF